MLTSLHLGNFKAFGRTQRLPIKPLTLIFGANSSGKSSLIHGLLLSRHALDTGSFHAVRTDVGGDSVDLGGFACYVHRRNLESRVEIRFELGGLESTPVAWLKDFAGSVAVELTVGCEVDIFGKPVRDGRPRIIRSVISLGGTDLLVISHRTPKGVAEAYRSEGIGGGDDPLTGAKRLQTLLGSEFRIDRLNTDHPAFSRWIEALVLSNTTAQKVTAEDQATARDALSAMLGELALDKGRLLPARVRLGSVPRDGGDVLAALSRADRAEDLTSALQTFLPRALSELLAAVEGVLSAALLRLSYLGPLRSCPPRHLAGLDDHDRNWTAGGGYAWDAVRKDPKLREMINGWLGGSGKLQTRYLLEVRRFISPRQAEAAIAKSLDEGLRERRQARRDWEGDEVDEADEDVLTDLLVSGLEKDESLDRLDELVLLDQRTKTTVSHRDVGVGISQVLPVLVHAYADKDRLIAIEQPEIHLHPALQAELGDVFIQSALGEQRNTFLLETHSEHLILRVLRRIRETHQNRLGPGLPPVRPSDVAILFVQPSEQGAEVLELRVDEQGRLIDPWPGGFFEEAFDELF